MRLNAKLLDTEGGCRELLAGDAGASDSTDWSLGERCRREDGSGSGGCFGERRGFVFWASIWFRTATFDGSKFVLSAQSVHKPLCALCPNAASGPVLAGYHDAWVITEGRKEGRFIFTRAFVAMRKLLRIQVGENVALRCFSEQLSRPTRQPFVYGHLPGIISSHYSTSRSKTSTSWYCSVRAWLEWPSQTYDTDKVPYQST